MRVLYFSRDYTTHDRRFLAKLTQSDLDVYYLRLEDDGLLYEARSLPSKVHLVNWQDGNRRLPWSFDALLNRLPEFEALLKQVSPDLIHAGPVQSCGFMAAIQGWHPFLLASWGSDVLVHADRDDVWQWVTKYTLSRSDAILCDCDAVRTKIQQLVPYPDNRIVQFPWGIDLHDYSIPASQPLGIRDRLQWDDKFVLISTRTWESIYGIDTLLDGFRMAVTKNCQLRLIMLGNGSMAGEIDQYIARHNLADFIFRPGIIANADLPKYFAAADAYVSCAHSDGTSISLLEAMAMELPVVVTDIPGNREWVKQGVNGRLTAVGDADSLMQAVLLVAEMNPTERRQMGRQNRVIVESRADWHSNFSKLLAAYDRLMAGRSMTS